MLKKINSEFVQVILLLLFGVVGFVFAYSSGREVSFNDSSRAMISLAAEIDGDIYMKRFLYKNDKSAFDSFPPFDKFVAIAYQGDDDKAQALAIREIRNQPENIIYLLYIASHCFARINCWSAENKTFDLTGIRPESFKSMDSWFAHIIKAHALAAAGQKQKAAALINKLPPEPFANAELIQNLLFALAVGDRKNAQKHAAALVRDPRDFLSLKLLVDFYLLEGRADEAEKILSTHLAANSGSFVYHSFKHAVETGAYAPAAPFDHARAIAHLIYTYAFSAYRANREDGEIYAALMERTLSLDPSFDLARIGLVGAYSALGDQPMLDRTLNSLDHKSFLYSFAMLQHAKFLLSDNRPREAKRALAKIPPADFGFGNSLIMLGDIKFDKGDNAAARKFYTEAAEKTKGIFKADALYKLFLLDDYENRPRPDASDLYHELIELDSDNRVYTAGYAVALAATDEPGDRELALRFATRLVNKYPGWPRALEALAFVLLKKGEVDAAENFLKLAYSRDPESWSIKDRLATVFTLKNNTKAAEELWESAALQPLLPPHKKEEFRAKAAIAAEFACPLY